MIKVAVSDKRKKKNKIQMPGSAQAGISLLIVGALLVAFGQYLGRGALSLYGIIVVACGFVLYMAASFVAKRRARV